MDLLKLLNIQDGVLKLRWPDQSQMGLTHIEVPSCVREIGECAFLNDETVESIVIPSSVIKIDKHAVCQCYKLRKIYIPKSVTIIEEEAFHRCSPELEIFCEGEPQKGWINKIEKKIIEDRIITDEDNAFNFHRSSGGWSYTTVKREVRIRHKWNAENFKVHTNVTLEEFLKK